MAILSDLHLLGDGAALRREEGKLSGQPTRDRVWVVQRQQVLEVSRRAVHDLGGRNHSRVVALGAHVAIHARTRVVTDTIHARSTVVARVRQAVVDLNATEAIPRIPIVAVACSHARSGVCAPRSWVVNHSRRRLYNQLAWVFRIVAHHARVEAIDASPAGCAVAGVTEILVIAAGAVQAGLRVALIVLPRNVVRRQIQILLEYNGRSGRDRWLWRRAALGLEG